MVKCVEQIHSQLEANTLGKRKALAQSKREIGCVWHPVVAECCWVVGVPCGKVLIHTVLNGCSGARGYIL